MAGIRDPKPASSSWAIGEKLLQAQLTKILENQRVANSLLFTNFRPWGSIGISAGNDPLHDILYSHNNTGTGYARWFVSGDINENSFYETSTPDKGTWTASSPGLTASGTVKPSRGANKNDHATDPHHLWFGLTRGGATSEGYIHYDGSTWSIVNRAAAGTGVDDVIGMWYWEEMDTFIASWRYATNAHRFETNTADAGWVDRSNGLTGDVEVYSADMSATDFVAIGQNPSGSGNAEVCHSTNGTTFTAVSVATKVWKCIAYDRTEGIWYLLASDWTLYTSTDPANGFSQEVGFTAPTVTGLFGATGRMPPKMVVQGGIIAIGGVETIGTANTLSVIVTRDMGATWNQVTPQSQVVNDPIMKVLDGRLVAILGWDNADGDVPYVGLKGLEPTANFP